MDKDLRPTIAALVGAIHASLRALNADLRRMENGERVSVGTVTKECDVLSGNLSKLDKFIDRMGPEKPAPQTVDPRAAPPVDIWKLAEFLRRVKSVQTGNICEDCGCPHPA